MRSWSIYALILLSLGITFSTALFIHYAEIKKVGDTEKVINTHRNIHYGNQLIRSLQSTQTAQRNFLVTEDSLHINTYRSSIKQTEDHLEELQQAVQQDEQHKILVNQQLIPAIEQKKAELDSSLTLYEEEGRRAAIEFIDISSREQSLAVIKDLINQLLQRKEHQLIEQVDRLDKSYDSYNVSAYVGLFLIAIVIVLAFRIIYRQSQENQKLVEQLKKKNHSLILRHDREVQLSREKTRSINYAAHDLRNPLNAITSIAGLIQERNEPLDAEHKEYWHIVSEAAKQMTTLINDLLDIQKIEEGTTAEPDTEEVNVAKVVKDIMKGFEGHAREKNISLEIQTDPDMIFCIDKAMFCQIAENLLSNAIKFSPHGSRVAVHVRSKSDHFSFKVIDEGPGIKESEMDRLFMPYEKLSARPTGNEKSTGLGLPIVKDRVEALGGTIDCQSEVGVGTTFAVELPDLC